MSTELGILLFSDLVDKEFDEKEAATETKRATLSERSKAVEWKQELLRKLAHNVESSEVERSKVEEQLRTSEQAVATMCLIGKAEKKSYQDEVVARVQEMTAKISELKNEKALLATEVGSCKDNGKSSELHRQRSLESKQLRYFTQVEIDEQIDSKEIRGYIAQSHNTQTFEYNTNDRSAFFMTNSVWSKMSIKSDCNTL